MIKMQLKIMMLIMLTLASLGLAQGPHQHRSGHQLWPDSLTTITISGTALVDSGFFHPVYFLDENGDGTADYHLAFGPWWYEPESGATRPADGENITITGELTGHNATPTLIVFQINGLPWREPVLYGMRGWNSDHFWNTMGDTLTVAGVVFVDTTYFYDHYFLDTDGDSLPEYRLGFGPPWFQPENGATRPANGDTVTIFGWVHETAGIDMLAVSAINGLEWRSLGQPAPWAGAWMHRNHTDSTFVYCVNDSSNWLGFAPGHMGGFMGGPGMFPDSSFIQFWQVHPDSVPGGHQDAHFMAFYLDVHDPFGNSMMDGRFGGGHGRMQFQKVNTFRFHYYEDDLAQERLDEQHISMLYWDDETQQWLTISGINVDTDANTVTFTSSDLSNYYLLAATTITGINDGNSRITPAAFLLRPNYPNPFNPATTIEFELPAQAHVRLSVYNLKGQKVVTLLDETKPSGVHRVLWRGTDQSGLLPGSGVYLVKLEAGNQVQIRRLTLLK